LIVALDAGVAPPCPVGLVSINNKKPKWGIQSPKLLDHPLTMGGQRVSLSLEQPPLANGGLPGQLGVLSRPGDERSGLAVRLSPQLLGGAGGRRLDSGPFQLGLGQELPSLPLKAAGLLSSCLQPVSSLRPGGQDRCLDASAGLGQQPGGDHPSLLKHLGRVRLTGDGPLRSLPLRWVDVQPQLRQCSFGLVAPTAFLGKLLHQLGRMGVHQTPIVAPVRHCEPRAAVAGIGGGVGFAGGHVSSNA
jgi:hypothetical protein